ncbi:TniQ family protein [Rhodobacteraceae bacterium S2214]|nr:TniQ family protein [Rhodobacteraceae bacterium S2214]
MRGESRVCPACLLSDTDMRLTSGAMTKTYIRTLWVISSARVCPVHKLALIPPPEDSSKHEFVDAWLPWMFEVVEGELDQKIIWGGLYDDHVVRRLNGDHPEGWANSFPIGALGAICEVLGGSVIHGKTATLGRLSQEELAIATSAGSAMLNAGPSEVRSYFERLRTHPGKPQDRPQARYGRIYDWLKRGTESGPEFEPLKDLLRHHILENWPFGGRRTGAGPHFD